MSVSTIDEIRDGLYRATTFNEKLQLSFNQFFIRCESESGDLVCVETGTRANFPELTKSLSRAGLCPSRVAHVVVPHFEADEMGALAEFIVANPDVTAHGHPMCTFGLADIFAVKVKPFSDGQPVTLSGLEIVPIFAKHVHQWDSLVVYVPKYKALLSSDIFMRYGLTTQANGDDLAGIVASIKRSDFLPSLSHLAAALRKMLAFDIEIILPMHGPAIEHDIGHVIAGLIDFCETRVA